MNYNNYNGYQNGYYNPYSQPYQNQKVNYPNNNYSFNQPQQMINNKDFDYVNGIEEAKNYILNPNQLIYLKDKQSNLIFVKKADEQGRYILNAYELREVNQNKETEYVKKSDLLTLEEKINKLSALLENKNDSGEVK